MDNIKIIDAFNNIGLPQIAQKVRSGELLESEDLTLTKNTILLLDKNYKKEDLNKYETRNTIKNYCNNLVLIYRCYRNYID